MSIGKELVDIITTSKEKGTGAYDTQATVVRVEGTTAWVHIPGGVDETPVRMTMNAKQGDAVQVRVSGGTAFLIGNASSPPTDDTTANIAVDMSTESLLAAESAIRDATRASEAAAHAEGEAAKAQDSANEAQSSASQAVESAAVAGRAASVAQAAAEAAQGEITEQKEWFYHDTNGSHVLGDTSGYRTDISSDGMRIVKTETEQIISMFALGQIILGLTNSSIRNVITNTSLAFQTDSGPVAYFGLNEDNIWVMHIDNAYVDDMLMFGDFALIKRDNGNLTLKWLG